MNDIDVKGKYTLSACSRQLLQIMCSASQQLGCYENKADLSNTLLLEQFDCDILHDLGIDN